MHCYNVIMFLSNVFVPLLPCHYYPAIITYFFQSDIYLQKAKPNLAQA